MGEVITGKNGVKYCLTSQHDAISRVIRLDGELEPELHQVTSHIINGRQGRVLDVGANMGTYCLPLSRDFPDVEFVAFEVQRTVLDQLISNISLNNAKNVVAIHAGLSDKAETIVVTIPHYESETNIGAFSLDEEVRNSDTYLVKTIGETESFSLLPLDTFAFKDVLLIKIDVEGMELKVLRGAKDTIKENHFPPILFEAWTWIPWFQERRKRLFEYLEGMGYRITQLGENNIAQHTSRPALLFKYYQR